MMPIQQTCPICHRIFMGSDCIGLPCERCCKIPVTLIEIDATEGTPIQEILKQKSEYIMEPEKQKISIDTKKTVNTIYYIALKPSDIIRLLKYEGVEVPDTADFEPCSDYEINEKYPLEIKWEVTSYE